MNQKNSSTSTVAGLNSEQLFARSLKVAPGGVHSPVRAFKSVGGTPVFFKEADGAHLTSVEGRRYLDFCQSFGPLILGHRDPEVSQIVHETADRAWSFGACEPYSLELAEWITSRISHVEKLRFVSSGTEAVMSALRVARAFTGRNKVLKFDGCYHGHVDSLLVKAGSGLAGLASSDSAGVSKEVAESTIVAPLDDIVKFQEIFELNKSEIAAVIIEPLPANYGLLIQRKEFLHEVARAAKAAGCLLIFDEVISGFRVALGGMADVLGMQPDLVTYGKVIGGGFPVGCYGGRADIMNMVAPSGPVYQAGTLSANPIGMRAGLATLQKVERENVYQQLEQRAALYQKQVEALFVKHNVAMQMSRFGSIIWMHQSTPAPIRSLNQIPKEHGENFKRFFHACLKEELYLAPSGYEVGFIGLAHTPQVLADAVSRLDAALKVCVS